MAAKASVKQLKKELEELRFKVKLIRTAASRSSSVSELENLRVLLRHIEKLIDLNIGHTMERRLDHRIEVSEKIESAIEKNLRKIRLDQKTSKFGASVLHRGWTESLERSRLARQKEQKAILDALQKEVSKIQKVIAALGLQFYPVLTQNLPAPISPTHPSTIGNHKGRKPGAWSKALDACVKALGEEVEYLAAADWLDWNRSRSAQDFAAKYGASITKGGRPVLQPTLRTNQKARQQFHKDLNAAKRRIRSKKKI